MAFHHTNTTGSHISGNHDGALSGLEFVQDPVTLILLLVTVDSCENCQSMIWKVCWMGEKVTYRVLAIHPGGGNE